MSTESKLICGLFIVWIIVLAAVTVGLVLDSKEEYKGLPNSVLEKISAEKQLSLIHI